MALSASELAGLRQQLWDEGGPHVAIRKALEGLTAEQAFYRPSPDRHSIWQHVMHVAFWREYLLSDLTGQRKPLTKELVARENWPAHPASAGAEAWNAARQRLEATQEGLQAQIAALDEARLSKPLHPEYRLSLGAQLAQEIAHDSYHLGQIMLLRALQGLEPLD